jgi:hypothetical protein
MPSRFTSTGRVLALGGALPYRAALLATTPTYAWLAEDLAAGAVAAWSCAVTGVQATQGTAGARPTQSATALNSRPGLTFDGGDWLRTAAFASAIAQPYSVVMAVQLSRSATLPDVMVDGIGGGRGSLAIDTISAVRRFVSFTGGTVANVMTFTTSAFPVDTTVVVRSRSNGTSSLLALNGVEQSQNNGGTQALTGVTLGSDVLGTSGWLGVIADILIFSGTDDAARAASAEALMRAYYGI